MRSKLLMLLVFALAPLHHTQATGAQTQAALASTFPSGTIIEARTLLLNEADRAWIRDVSGRTPRRVLTAHIGTLDGELQGMALVDTHPVRSLHQTLMITVSPAGTVTKIRVLAFHEPAEYRAPQRWIDQLIGRALSPQLRLGGQIDGLSGATLTARATTGAARYALAIQARMLGERTP